MKSGCGVVEGRDFERVQIRFFLLLRKLVSLKDEIVLRDFSCVSLVCCAIHPNLDNVL